MNKFSDIENIFQSRNLIENLQSTNNRISVQINVPPLRQEFSPCKNISKCNWKEIKLSKLGTLNTSQEHKQIEILNRRKSASKTRRNRDESSDSDDFLSPNKKRKKSKIHSVNIFSNPDKDYSRTRFSINSVNTYQKNDVSLVKGMSKSQSDLMVISRQKTSGNQTKNASNQESCGSRKLGASSQDIFKTPETSTSQESRGSKMIISSQDTSNSQMSTSQESYGSKIMTSSQDTSKIITASQSPVCQNIISSQDRSKIITSSQESPVCENMISSQESCTSPKRIASSQESLGNKVMTISIQDNANILNTDFQSNSGTQIVITPHINSSRWRFLANEETKCSESNIMNQSVNSKKLKVSNQLSLVNDTLSRKKMKTSDKKNFAAILANSVSDSFYNKTFRRYNKADKRMIWNIRRRELEVTKKEKEIENREKLLDAREADIQKREAILKASQRRYFCCKSNIKKKIQKQTINPKELRQRLCFLMDETNAFKDTSAFKVFK